MSTKLAGKLVEILQNLGSVPKKGYNKHQNYYYMREVDVMDALKEQLVKHKIILLTSSKLVEVREKLKIDKNDNKTVDFITTVATTHTFIDSVSGEQLSIDSVGQGQDSGDKGSGKSITSATKYAIMKTFMISDESQDVENDGITKHETPAIINKTFNKPLTQITKQVDTITNTVNDIKTTINLTNTPSAVKETPPTQLPRTFSKRTLNKGTEPNF